MKLFNYRRSAIPTAATCFISVFFFLFLSCSSDSPTESSPDYTLHIEIIPEDAGTTDPPAGDFHEGDNLRLRAIPTENYLFDRWEGDLTTVSNPADLTMNSDKFITAIFSRAPLSMGGDGSVADPYQVYSLADLVAIGLEENLDKHYIQMGDIDAGESIELQNGSGFQPIGTRELPFTGSFRGNGYSIFNLYIHNQRNSTNATGFIGYMKNGLIEDVTIDNQSPDWVSDSELSKQHISNFEIEEFAVTSSDISNERGVGGLIGFNDGGTIRNSVYRGDVVGHIHQRIGGFVGVNTGLIENCQYDGEARGGRSAAGFVHVNSGQILNSSATGKVNAMSTYGFVNSNLGEITHSFANVEIYGSLEIAGFVQRNEGTIRSSFMKGTLFGHRHSGGFARHNYGLIEDAYVLAETEIEFLDVGDGDFLAGGFAGTNHAAGEIRNSFVAGVITVDLENFSSYVYGGFAANNAGTISSGFWDVEASGLDVGIDEGNPEGATGLTTAQMTGSSAELNMPGFNWVNVWRTTEDGYPALRWE